MFIITPTVIETAASLLALVGTIWQMGRWSQKVDTNTQATEKLSDTFEGFTEKVTGTLADHEVRLQINEHDIAALKQNADKKLP